VSNPESFIQEVTEEVRRDRLFGLMRRYGWIGVLLVVGVVGGTAWTEWSKARAAAEAQAFGDALRDALDLGAPEDRRAALAAIPATASQRAVLDLILATDPEENRAETLAALERLAADTAQPQSWRDLASLLRSKPPVAMDPRIRQAIALMRQDVARELDVDGLAAATGLSRAHFFTLFQRDTRVTPLVYANVLRFEAAVQRLTHSQEPVGDVSHELGFSAPSHFSRFFRAHLGITPSDYRRKVNLFEPPRGPRSDLT